MDKTLVAIAVDPFGDWLVKGGYSANTAYQYMTVVKHVLLRTDAKDQSPEALHAALESLPLVTRGKASSALAKYIDFLNASKTGGVAPDITALTATVLRGASSRRPSSGKTPAKVSNEVVLAVLQCANELKAHLAFVQQTHRDIVTSATYTPWQKNNAVVTSLLPQLRALHAAGVKPAKMDTFAILAASDWPNAEQAAAMEKNGVYVFAYAFQLPLEKCSGALEVLYRYGDWNAVKEQRRRPLVPKEPQSSEPMDVKTLRALKVEGGEEGVKQIEAAKK